MVTRGRTFAAQNTVALPGGDALTSRPEYDAATQEGQPAVHYQGQRPRALGDSQTAGQLKRTKKDVR